MLRVVDGHSSVAPECPPANEWTVRHSPAHREVLLSHEKGRSMNPGHSGKYITPSDKSQTHRDKICDTKILIDPPVGYSRPRLEPVTPAVDPRLCQQPGQDRATARAGYHRQTIKRSSVRLGTACYVSRHRHPNSESSPWKH